MKKGINITGKDLLLIGGGLIAFTAVRKLLIAGGVIPGPGGRSVQTLQIDPGSYFKPPYYKRTGGLLITRATAESYAKQIHDAFGLFQDDFNSIMAVFSKIKTKAGISFLADVFQQKYKQDLLTFLTNGGGILPWDGLSDSQFKTLLDFTNRLPKR